MFVKTLKQTVKLVFKFNFDNYDNFKQQKWKFSKVNKHIFLIYLQDFPQNWDISKRFPNLTHLEYRSHSLSATYPDVSGYHGNLITLYLFALKKGEVEVS